MLINTHYETKTPQGDKMKISNEQFLENLLRSKKAELKDLEIDNKIHQARYSEKTSDLYREITKIEKQLEKE